MRRNGDVFIETYGAIPDGVTVNTEAIQRAIDACHEAGGGRVVCGPGQYVTGTIELKSGVELYLSPGCSLMASTSLSDYKPFIADGYVTERSPEKSSESLIRAMHAEHIAITGPGEINGRGIHFYDTDDVSGRFFSKPDTPRPRLVMVYNCRHVRLESTAFIDSPCWTIWFMKCEHVRVHGIRIEGDRRMINNDGIDVDSCRYVTISDCIIKTADDCIVLRSMRRLYREPKACENVTVTNCVLESACQGVRIGCPNDYIVRNCTLSNLVITSDYNGIVCDNPKRYYRAHDTETSDVRDIVVSDVVIRCEGTPIRLYVEEGIRLRKLGNLTFSNIRMTSGQPIHIEGNRETIIDDIRLNNVTVHTSGNEGIVSRYCRNVRFDGFEVTHISDE